MKLAQIPKITYKQTEILKLIYSHRFLNRIQIQTMMKHKDKKTINLWLRDLKDKEYLRRIYNKDHFAEKTKPAIYYIGINGIRYFMNKDIHATGELRKRYKEHERSQTFIDRSLTIADCVITLGNARDEESIPLTWYFYETRADYLSDSYYHFLADNEYIQPHLCFSKQQYESIGEPEAIESYLLEIFDPTLPRYRLRNRLKKYVEYLDEDIESWDEGTFSEDPRPAILLVCATLTDLIYAKRRTKGLLADIWEYEDEDRPDIRFTTIDKSQTKGILSEAVWEKA